MTRQWSALKELLFFVKWGLVAALIAGFFFVIWLYKRVDEQLRLEIERRCAKSCPHLRIQIRSAQLLPGEGIQLRGIRVAVPNWPRARASIAEVEEISLLGPVDYKGLLAGRVPVHRVVVRRPRVRVVCDERGRWNVAQALPLPQVAGNADFPIEVENGTLEVVDLRGSTPSTVAFRDLQIRVDGGRTVSSSTGGQSLRTFRGTLTGDFLRRLDFEGTVDAAGPRIRVSGAIDSLEFSREFLAALPRDLADKLNFFEHLRAQLSLSFRVFWDPATHADVDFEVSGQVKRGRWDDPRLPYAVTDVRGSFLASREGLTLSEASGISGATSIVIHSARLANSGDSPLTHLDMQVRNLRFDPALLDFLPRFLREEWPKYFPEGTVHLTVRLNPSGAGPAFHVVADLENASFAYYRFPYRLQNAQGRLELTPERLGIHVIALAGNKPVEIRGQIANPLTAPMAQISVSGQGIALDEKLFNAVLDSKTRQTLRALHLSGFADVWLGLWQDEPRGVLHRHLEADIRQCSLRYEEFPYPISDISGRVTMEDDAWSFQQLRGTSGPAQITAQGTLMTDRDGTTLLLQFEGRQVRLDNELRDAFPQECLRRTWDDLDPGGLVDVRGSVTFATGRSVQVRFQAVPVGRGLTIQPRLFPYRLEDIQGSLVYEGGCMFFRDLRGRHGSMEFQADGACSFDDNGSWQLDFSQFWIDRLEIDRALLAALPEGLGRPLARLNIQGPLSLRGRFRLAKTAGSTSPSDQPPKPAAVFVGEPQGASEEGPRPTFAAEWDLVIGLVQNTLGTGLMFENINGKVAFRGHYQDGRFAGEGTLDLDALQILGLPMTRLRGPFRIENDVVIFGPERSPFEFAASGNSGRDLPSISSQLTASFFEGLLSGGGWVRLSQPLQYDVSLSLVKADFNRLVGEYHNGPSAVRGTLDAAVRLKGQGDDVQGLGGYGNFQLREADVYELPLMMALLKILSIRRPNPTAFSESSGQFRIAGRHIYLDSITFWGDAFSLTGQGEADLDGNVRLVMRAILGRREIQVPVIREVFRGASEQIVLVHVGGTLKDPVVRREPFPGVSEVLQRFQLGTGGLPGQTDARTRR